MFKIQIPITNKERLDRYMSIGLKNGLSFYGGFNNLDWKKISGGFTNSNRRYYDASFGSIEDFRNIINRIESLGHEFSYVFNQVPTAGGDSNMDTEFDFINNVMKPRSIIMNDFIFMKDINKDINIHVSTLAGVHNSESVNYWRKKIPNIDRLIFPREVIIDNILDISKNTGNLNLEMFVKNSWCYHSNSHCSSYHSKKIPYLCHRERGAEKLQNIKIEDLNKLWSTKIHCKICSLYKLKDEFLNNKKKDMFLKVVGRDFKIEKLVDDIKFIDEGIENCKKADSAKKFIALNIHSHKKIFGQYCGYKNCEYFLQNNEK